MSPPKALVSLLTEVLPLLLRLVESAHNVYELGPACEVLTTSEWPWNPSDYLGGCLSSLKRGKFPQTAGPKLFPGPHGGVQRIGAKSSTSS